MLSAYNSLMGSKFNLSIIILAVFYFSFLIICDAQPNQQPIQIGLHYHQGFLLNHSPKRTNTGKTALNALYGFEITALWQTLGSKPWHKYYGFPKWGASFVYFNVGSNKTYIDFAKGDSNMYNVNWGEVYALLIHSSLKPISTPKFELNIRIGTGFGYFTEIYNGRSNAGNLWISSRINPAMHLTIECQYKITKQWAVVAGGSFTHFSNGATRMPNLGINLPTATVGLRFTPFPERLIFKRDSIYPSARRNYFHFSMAAGAKILGEFGTTLYPSYTCSFMYGRRIGKISKLLLSIDAFRDESLIEELSLDNKSINRIGLWAGHEFIHGKLGFLMGAGYYIYKQTLRDPNVYLKIGIRRYIDERLFIGVLLKTHYGQADNFEWTLGYTL